jgi:hypothetical protein
LTPPSPLVNPSNPRPLSPSIACFSDYSPSPPICCPPRLASETVGHQRLHHLIPLHTHLACSCICICSPGAVSAACLASREPPPNARSSHRVKSPSPSPIPIPNPQSHLHGQTPNHVTS